jgi:hypothetical protein
MIPSSSIPCPFCGTPNPAGETTCQACGAPLAKTAPPPPRPSLHPQAPKPPVPQAPVSQANLESARKAGDEVEKLASTALYTYSLFWRTIADGVVIASIAFSLGVTGGATGRPGMGILAAIALGWTVGFAVKSWYLTLASAPLGLLLGAGLGVLLYFLGMGRGWLIFPVAGGAILAANLGGRGQRYALRNPWEKLRPFLGAIGGLLFGALGLSVGLALTAVAAALLR